MRAYIESHPFISKVIEFNSITGNKESDTKAVLELYSADLSLKARVKIRLDDMRDILRLFLERGYVDLTQYECKLEYERGSF